MKKILFAIVTMVMSVMPMYAIDYDEIRENALFLTDKMAYELNLSEEQYEAAYEINYDYFYEIMTGYDFDDDDVYGHAWRSRNRDLRIILLTSQYNAFKRLKYFYRPFHCSHGRITINIYNYYPRRDYLYFGCPNFVINYHGGHSWRHYSRHSYYSGRAWHRNVCYGMRDGYHNGNRYYHNNTHNHGRGHHFHRDGGRRYDRDRNCNNSFRNTNNRGRVSSSTRTTVRNGNDRFRNSFNNNRSRNSYNNTDKNRRLPDNKFSPRNNRSNNRSRNVSNISRERGNKDKDNNNRRTGFGGGR